MPDYSLFDIFFTMLLAKNQAMLLAALPLISEQQWKNDKISFQVYEGIGIL